MRSDLRDRAAGSVLDHVYVGLGDAGQLRQFGFSLSGAFKIVSDVFIILNGLPLHSNRKDYSDPRHEHDEPQEERYADLPFFDRFRIPAGWPDEVLSDPTASTHKVVRHLAKEYRYVIRVKGDSMAPRIEDGDLILVDYAKEPRPGNIVVAAVNGGVVVKKYLRREGRVVLKSMNSQYADIEIKETDQFEFKGVVLRIVEGAL
jgi:DNA polymerase V